MKKKLIISSCLVAVLLIGAILSVYLKPILIALGSEGFEGNFAAVSESRKNKSRKPPVVNSTSTPSSFLENFDSDYTLQEAGSMDGSSNPNWWVSSGGYLFSKNAIGSTILGDLSAIDPWRVAFSISNSLDTDNGYHPQNIFRLATKSTWQNFRQEAYFKIMKNNISDSPNRNASNGLFFFNRYQDQYSLYYTGIRVDGYAVIKKKINGTYYTMAYKPVFTGNQYDVNTNPNLLPLDTWLGLRSEVVTNPDKTVSVRVYIDKNKTGSWTLVAEAKDDGSTFGAATIANAGSGGIRTDFMDVQFDDYRITSL